MTSEQIQQVVNAENERLNEIALAKATTRLRDIHSTTEAIKRYQKQLADLQAEVLAIQFDTVTVADVVGTAPASE